MAFRLPTTLPFALALLVATAAGAADSQQKVGNFIPFDLAVCFLQPATVEQPVTDTALSGLWILARPRVLECLADTRLYVPGKPPSFKITLAVTESGYTPTVESEGLTSVGKKCIEDAVGKVSPSMAPLPAGSKPVTFSDQVPELAPAQQVRFGVNEASDVAGTVRLAMPSLCSCFASYKDTPDPAPINLQVLVTRAPEKFKRPEDGVMPKPVEVTVSNGPAAPVKACIAEKLSALSYPSKSDQVMVPYEFALLNALSPSTDVTALPEPLKFAQLDVMAIPRSAASQLELARQVATSGRYNALVKTYQGLSKSDPKKAHTMLKDLVASCKHLVAQDDVYIETLQKEAKLRQDQLTLASSLKAKDPAWAAAETAAKKATTDSEALVAKARELRAGDEKVCPKVHL